MTGSTSPSTNAAPPTARPPDPGQGYDEIEIDIDLDATTGTRPTGPAPPGFDELDILIDQATGADQADTLAAAEDGPTSMTCTCLFQNSTDETLTVVQASLSLDNGKLTLLPDAEVDAGQRTRFIAENTKVWTPIPVIGDVGVFGIEGHVKYTFPDDQTTLTLHFDNPRFEKWGKTTAEAVLDGPDKAAYTATGIAGTGADAVFRFEVKAKGGRGTVPPKGNTPAPQPTSCLVTVVNQTQQPLTLDDQQNETGDFMTNPGDHHRPRRIRPVRLRRHPAGQDPGLQGRVHLPHRPGHGHLAPRMVQLRRRKEHRGRHRHLRHRHLPLAGTDRPGRGQRARHLHPLRRPRRRRPGPRARAGPALHPAASAKEPTMRKGDKAPDGWIEYLQTCLLTHNENVTVDGDFGPATLKAVLSFQKKNKLQVDGTVGNQTWPPSATAPPSRPAPTAAPPTPSRKPAPKPRFLHRTRSRLL